ASGRRHTRFSRDWSSDVCSSDLVLIIGAGFTGLSTAIHLKEKRPSLKVLVLESDVVGFGASGRNGGFSMRLFGITMELTAMRYGERKSVVEGSSGGRGGRRCREP